MFFANGVSDPRHWLRCSVGIAAASTGVVVGCAQILGGDESLTFASPDGSSEHPADDAADTAADAGDAQPLPENPDAAPPETDAKAPSLPSDAAAPIANDGGVGAPPDASVPSTSWCSKNGPYSACWDFEGTTNIRFDKTCPSCWDGRVGDIAAVASAESQKESSPNVLHAEVSGAASAYVHKTYKALSRTVLRTDLAGRGCDFGSNDPANNFVELGSITFGSFQVGAVSESFRIALYVDQSLFYFACARSNGASGGCYYLSSADYKVIGRTKSWSEMRFDIDARSGTATVSAVGWDPTTAVKKLGSFVFPAPTAFTQQVQLSVGERASGAVQSCKSDYDNIGAAFYQ